MPICPKCGKSFSSEQALTYHLNKKYKCGTWKCASCNSVFSTQFAMKIHNMSCKNIYTSDVPSYDVLCKLYSSCPFVVYEVDNNDIIHSVSPSVKKYGFEPIELIGKCVSSMCETVNNDLYMIKRNGDRVLTNRYRIADNIVIALEI